MTGLAALALALAAVGCGDVPTAGSITAPEEVVKSLKERAKPLQVAVPPRRAVRHARR
jgi:hypothetical protein